MSLDNPVMKPDSDPRRDRRWLYLALVIYVVLVGRIVGTRHYCPTGDSSTYISAAIALHQGVGLRNITAPISKPENWARIPTWIQNDPQAMAKPDWPFFVKYPPGLPLLLVPFLWVGKGSFFALQVLPLLCGALALLAVYRWRYELFPGAWRATLLWTAASQVTLFATRVQTETVLLPLVIVGLFWLQRAAARPERLVRYGVLSGLTFFAAAFIHPKVIFLCTGAVLWILLLAQSGWRRRVITAVVFCLLTIVPILSWATNLPWANDDVLSLSCPTFSTDPFAPGSPSVFSQPMVLARRILGMGHLYLESAGIVYEGARWHWPVVFDIAFYLVLLCGLVEWYKRGSTAIEVCVVCYLAGAFFSQGTSSRYMVVIEPFLIYALVIGFRKILKMVSRSRPRWEFPIQTVARLTLSGMLLISWAKMQPWRDRYCMARNRRYLITAKLAEQLPEDRVVFVERNPVGVALLSGRATIYMSPSARINANPKLFLMGGAKAVALWKRRTDKSQHLIDYLELSEAERSRWKDRVQSKTVMIDDLEFLVGTIGFPMDSVPTTIPESAAEDIPTRIHPRWMNLTRADAQTLWHSAVPSRAVAQEKTKESG